MSNKRDLASSPIQAEETNVLSEMNKTLPLKEKFWKQFGLVDWG